jgi:uncharacterized protein
MPLARGAPLSFSRPLETRVTPFVRALAAVTRRAPAVLVIAVILLTAGFGALSSQAQQDQGQESFSPDNPALKAAEFAADAFEGSTDTVVQVVVTGGDVVSPEGLATVTAVREAVLAAVPPEQLGGEGMPFLSYLAPIEAAAAGGQIDPATLTSDELVDAAYDDLLEQLPGEVVGISQRLVATTADGTPAADATTGLVLVFLDTDAIVGDLDDDEALTAQVAAVRSVTDAVAATATPLEASAFAFELFFDDDGSFTSEVGRLFAIAALIIVLILFVVYLFPPRGIGRGAVIRRTLADLGLTLFAILASITWMQGIGVLLGPDYLGLIGPFSPPTQIIPILLIGLGVDFAIHLTARYREEVSEGEHVGEVVTATVTTVGIALTLATATTALGFLTNVVNPVPAIKDFGILAAVGIVAAFLLTMTFLPAARLLLDRRADRAGRLPRAALAASSESRLSNATARASVLAERFPAIVLTVTLGLGALGAFGLTQLSTEFSFADFVPADNPVRETYLTIEEEFTGGFGEQTQVVLQGDVATSEVHNATVAAQGTLATVPGVLTAGDQAAAQSVVTVMAQTLQADPEGAFAAAAASNGLQPDFTFPAGSDVGAVYDTLYEATPQAAAVLARDGDAYIASQVVAQTQSAQVGAEALATSIEAVYDDVAAAGVEVTATGTHIITTGIISDLSSSQVSSLAVTLLAALLLLVAVFGVRNRRPELGLVTLAPVVLVVLWVFGTMAATGIPFGPVTATISGLAIGIGVPFTIHITHRFSEDLVAEHDIESALRSTMRHTGGALAGSAFTTMAGFAVLISSSLVPFRQLGLVVAYAIGYSLVAGIIVLPSMLALWARWRHPAELGEEPASRPAEVVSS